MGEVKVEKIKKIFDHYKELLSNNIEASLIHGDFDPANILVDKIENQWKITAILDWEFAFSGSWLWDVSNMLRYAHRMSKVYEQSFLKGIEDSGFLLPDSWEITIYLLNLISLLDCLSRGSQTDKPKRFEDINKLIHYIIKWLAI